VPQELFSMTMMASALPALIERRPEVARDRALRLQDLARGALAEMRALLFALRPASLADEGLVAAITKHAAAFEHREGITVNLEIDGEGRLPQAVEEALYRVAQEALHNVAKHARATSVWVTLALDDHHSALTIRDDGVGMDATAEPAAVTMGLRSMRERVEEIGGAFNVTSGPHDGTTVHVTVPVGVVQPADG